MFSRSSSTVLAQCLTITLCSASHAQWSSDPLFNLAVVDRIGEQTQPKVRPAADGGCYISWFDNGGGGYDVYLQRLDAGGNEQWVHNGVLIADRSFSSTQDYGLDVDGDDHALLTFRDDRFGGVQITAARIAPDGTLDWGPNSVQMTNTAEFVASPRIAATTDGEIVVAWTQDNDVRLQRLDAAGSALWASDVILSDVGTAGFTLSDLRTSDNGNVIVSWVRAQGFAGAKHIYARKLAPDGTNLWGPSPVIVFDGGSLQFGNFPPFLSDGAGGAVFCWYGVSPLQCYAQRILADGSEAFPHNGVAVAIQAGRDRVEPKASFNPQTGETFVFWREQVALPFQVGVYGQKLDSAGTRQWGSAGQVVMPLSATNDYQRINNLQYADGAMVFFSEILSFGNDRIRGSRLDGAGQPVWSPAILNVSTLPAAKTRLESTLNSDGIALLTWVDNREDSGDIYAQNVHPDCQLDPKACACPADVNGDGGVDPQDLALLLGAWGPNPAHPADINGDGTVNASDLALLLGAWGPC